MRRRQQQQQQQQPPRTFIGLARAAANDGRPKHIMPSLTAAEHKFAHAAFRKDVARKPGFPMDSPSSVDLANLSSAAHGSYFQEQPSRRHTRDQQQDSRPQLSKQTMAGICQGSLRPSPSQLASISSVHGPHDMHGFRAWPQEAARHPSSSSGASANADVPRGSTPPLQHAWLSDDDESSLEGDDSKGPDASGSQNGKHLPDVERTHVYQDQLLSQINESLQRRRRQQQQQQQQVHRCQGDRGPRKAPNVMALSMRVARLPAAVHPASSDESEVGSDVDQEMRVEAAESRWSAALPSSKLCSHERISKKLQQIATGEMLQRLVMTILFRAWLMCSMYATAIGPWSIDESSIKIIHESAISNPGGVQSACGCLANRLVETAYLLPEDFHGLLGSIMQQDLRQTLDLNSPMQGS